MKKIIKVLFLYFFFVLNQGYAQSWQWAVSAGGINRDVGGFSCIDALGNIYLTGNVDSNIVFFQTDTLQVSGINDIFIAKYDISGNEIWVKSFGGNYNNQFQQKYEGVSKPVMDPTSNYFYITGSFVGSCSFGTTNLFSQGGISDKEIFVAKFDLNGNCIWAKSAGSSGDDESYGLAVRSNGEIYISGTLKGNGVFDSISIFNGGFLAKFDSAGNCIFSKIICNGINLFSGASGVPWVINNFNNSIFLVIGKVSDTLILDTSSIVIPSNNSFILAKFDLNGNIQSYKVCGGPNPEFGELSIDNNGNCYFVSRFFGGEAIFENDTIHAFGNTDFFLAKYDFNLNFQWVRQSHASINARAIGCSSDLNGNVYISGSFSGSALFGTYGITSNTSEDLFVARYDKNGNCLGVRHQGQGLAYGVQTISDGSCIVTGSYVGNVTFGSLSTLINHGDKDIFIAKSDAITGLGGQNRVVQNQLIIYANPNKGTFNIKVPDEIKSFKQAWLFVYDVSGKEIARFNLDNESDTPHFDISNSNPGSYSVKLVQGDKMYSGQMIVE
jgi:Secretion system C-terminal sorting domain